MYLPFCTCMSSFWWNDWTKFFCLSVLTLFLSVVVLLLKSVLNLLCRMVRWWEVESVWGGCFVVVVTADYVVVLECFHGGFHTVLRSWFMVMRFWCCRGMVMLMVLLFNGWRRLTVVRRRFVWRVCYVCGGNGNVTDFEVNFCGVFWVYGVTMRYLVMNKGN